MAKLFAVTIIIIAIASAVPIVLHIWEPPTDISVHGKLIDEQFAETMVEAGICFLVSQLVLGFFIWRFSDRPREEKIKNFSGRCAWTGCRRGHYRGVGGHGPGSLRNQGMGQYLLHPSGSRRNPGASCRRASSPFISAIPGPDGKFGPLHPEQISEATENFFGLDTTHDADSKDDIVTAEMAVPVNRDVRLLMHSKDVGHSFFVRELRIQQDFVPGLDLSLHFTPTKIGRYEIRVYPAVRVRTLQHESLS